MKKSLSMLTALLAALSLVLFHTVEPDLRAEAPGVGFDLGSLRGSYGSVGRADGSKSVSVGVAEFDAMGGVNCFVRINASGQDGERRLIDLTSVGTYTVDPDGVGVIRFTNTFADGSTSDVIPRRREGQAELTTTALRKAVEEFRALGYPRESSESCSPVARLAGWTLAG